MYYVLNRRGKVVTVLIYALRESSAGVRTWQESGEWVTEGEAKKKF